MYKLIKIIKIDTTTLTDRTYYELHELSPFDVSLTNNVPELFNSVEEVEKSLIHSYQKYYSNFELVIDGNLYTIKPVK